MKKPIHYEGDLDIRARRKGVWTSTLTLIRTAGRGLSVCTAPFDTPVTNVASDVTCKRCLRLIEKANDTARDAPVDSDAWRLMLARGSDQVSSATPKEGT